MTATRRRVLLRQLVGSSILALLIAVGLVRTFGGGAAAAPPDRAAAFVPRDALVYLNLNSDRGSAQWKRAFAAMQKLPVLAQLRQALLSSAERGTVGDVALKRDVSPWLGDEAAYALLPRSSGQLMVLKVRDEKAARSALTRIASGGGDEVTLTNGFALIGSSAAVQAARTAAAAPGNSLATDATYRDLRGGLPHARLLTGYLSPTWIHAHLAGPAALLSGAARVPVIQAAAVSFGASSKRLELNLRGRPAAGAPPVPGCTGETGQSEGGKNLLSLAPAHPALFVGFAGAECILRKLIATPTGGIGRALAAFSARAQGAGVNVSSELLPLLGGDSALSVSPGANGSPTVALDVGDVRPDQGMGLLARLQPALISLLNPEADGTTPDLSSQSVAGANVLTSSLTAGLQLSYAAFGGNLVVSNAIDGIAAARKGQHLDQTGDFKTVLGDRPKNPSALVFLDLEKLLALADQAGLSSNPTYSAIRDDLQKIGAAGIVLAREGKDIDAELRLKSP